MNTSVTSPRATTWLVLCSMVAMLYFAREFLVPIALAAFVAFALAPFVEQIARAGLPRMLATTLTMAAVGVLVGAVGWLVAGQIQGFAEQMPTYRANLQMKGADLRASFGKLIEQTTSMVRGIGRDLSVTPAVEAPPTPAAAPDGNWWSVLHSALNSMADFSVVASLVLLLAFVMLLRWDDLRDRLLALASQSDLPVTTRAAKEASAKVGTYLRRQLFLNGVHGAAMGLILWWIGVPNPLVWGLLGATMRFVPYLGPIVSTVAPILVSFASSDGWSQSWIALGSLLSLELLTNSVLEPWLYGAGTGISPLALVISAAFWTWIWGPIGLVLSTPLTVCLIVVGKHFPRLRFLDVLFGDQPAMPQRSRLYQRLLVGEQDAAWEILRQEVARTSPIEAADRTLIPALGLAGQAGADGRIDVERRGLIGALAHALVDELDESRLPSPSPTATATRVLCFPARDALDAVGARLLAAELVQHGLKATASAGGELLGEVIESIRRDGVGIVCVSSVLPTHFLHVRSLCKKLLASDERLVIVVGLWGEDLDTKEIDQRLPNSPRVRVATSLAQAVAVTEAIAAPHHAPAALLAATP